MSDMSDTENENLLEVTDLCMHFSAGTKSLFDREPQFVYAVDGVSFTLHKGETLGLVGESGCGKSTVVRAVSRLYTPTSGTVRFKGKDMNAMNRHEMLEARRNLQIVFQNPYASLNPRMTTGDIIAEPLRIYQKLGLMNIDNAAIDTRVDTLMEMVGLLTHYKNRYPHEFSGGQRQRIGIARSLSLNPAVVLADEPVSALDVSIQAQVLNLFRDIQQELGLSYLFIAHDLAVIQYVSDRVAVMYLGHIVEQAKSDELYAHPLHPYTRALLSSAPIPDPEIEAKRHRIILTGDVPSPKVRQKGCPFYQRCPEAMEKCAAAAPALSGKEHQCACWKQV